MVTVKCQISNRMGKRVEEVWHSQPIQSPCADYIIGHCGGEVGMDRVQSFWGQRGDSLPAQPPLRTALLSGKEAILRFDICLIYGVQWY